MKIILYGVLIALLWGLSAGCAAPAQTTAVTAPASLPEETEAPQTPAPTEETTVPPTPMPTPEPTSEPTPEPTPPDVNAPEIVGVRDRECILGQPVVYLDGVSATDDVDGEVPVTVESQVDPNALGEYAVVYTAVDASGNTASQSCTFTVVELEASEEMIHQLAAEVMAKITTADMLPVEQAKAIFDFVHKNVKYGNGTNHNYTNWRKAAYQAFTKHVGDCYNIYAVTRALLDETDIEYLSVERVRTARRKTRHFWVMVNLGTGWYVFDPTYSNLHKAYAFMWTEQQCNRFKLYWNYDKTILPELATERFDYEKERERERAERTTE